MVKRKGFFFSMDAFLAIVIFSLILISIYGYFVGVSPLKQQYYLAEDLLTTLSNVKINELDLEEYPNIQNLKDNNLITNEDLTIIEQIIEFKEFNMIDEAETLLNDITDNLIPTQFGFSFTLDIEEIIEGAEEDASALVSRRRFVTGG